MGCVVAVVALLAPRVLMAFILLLTDWFGRAFETRTWPLLGFFFMPYTTLAYMGAMLCNDRSVSGWWFVLLILAIVADVAHWGGGKKAVQRRARPPRPRHI